MTDYERGTPAWDIGMLLTRHNDGVTKGRDDSATCARVLDLRRSAGQTTPAHVRLAEALALPCTCGAGDSESEQTSLGVTKKED